MNIYLGADHAGFEMKNMLAAFLRERGERVEDLGALVYDPADDYPDFIIPVARKVDADPQARGIVIGGSGYGEAIAANRLPRVRAVIWNGQRAAAGDAPNVLAISREHNDSNILSLGARFITFEEAKRAVVLWLETPFSGDERHVRRLKKIDQLTCGPL